MSTVRWIVGAIAVLGLAALSLMFGASLLPPRTVAQGKGILVPWLLTWGLIWMTTLIALFLTGYLGMKAMSKDRSR